MALVEDFDPQRLAESPDVAFLTGVNPDFISYVDVEYRYRFVNEAYAQATGRSREALLGKTIEEVWGDKAAGHLVGRVVKRALKAPAEAGEKLAPLAQVIESTLPAIERMMGALEGLRRFTRLDEPEEQMLDVRDGLDDTIALMEGDWRPEVQLERDYDEPPRTMGWPADLNQVFMHLLSNALEAIQGAGTVTARVRASKGRIEVAILDSGRGIEPERLGTLFEPQFSAGRGRVRAGLGLFISRDIVERHGGALSVESEVGRGSCFTVSLPVRG